MTHFVYLLEFEDKSIYIGQTINIKKRIYEHKKVFCTPFVYTIIDECESDCVLLFECMWMQLFRSWNLKLRNGRPWRKVNTRQRLTAGTKREKRKRIQANINEIRKPIFWKSGKEIIVVTWAEVMAKKKREGMLP